MKKLLLFAVVAMFSFSAAAQTVKTAKVKMQVFQTKSTNCSITLSVPEEVWGDGTGYQLLMDADHNTFGDIIPSEGPLAYNDLTEDVYGQFEYTIPEETEFFLNTDMILVEGDLTITIPAGIYDYCITNPTPNDAYWIAGGDDARGDDIEFAAGNHYVFTVEYLASTYGDNVTMERDLAGLERVQSVDFKLYPNPANKYVILQAKGVSEDITISDVQGRVLERIAQRGDVEMNIDLSAYAQGIYFLKIGNMNRKLIVQ